MDKYENVIRELARDQLCWPNRPIDVEPEQLAVIVRRYECELSEWIDEYAEDIASALESPNPVQTLGQCIELIVRTRALREIKADVEEMIEQLEREDRDDDAYTRGGLLA